MRNHWPLVTLALALVALGIAVLNTRDLMRIAEALHGR